MISLQVSLYGKLPNKPHLVSTDYDNRAPFIILLTRLGRVAPRFWVKPAYGGYEQYSP